MRSRPRTRSSPSSPRSSRERLTPRTISSTTSRTRSCVAALTRPEPLSRLYSLQTNAEREITLQQKQVRSHQDSLAAVKRENAGLVMRTEQNAKHITEVRSLSTFDVIPSDKMQAQLNSLLADRISQAESEMAYRKRCEEQASRVERELRATKPSAVSSSSSSGNESSEIRELKKYNEDLSVRPAPTIPLQPPIADLRLTAHRKCSSARPAHCASKVSSSTDAGTCFARSASTRACRTASASARPAVSPLARTTSRRCVSAVIHSNLFH